MATLLVTGFEPFGGDPRNPSGEVAEALAGLEPAGLRIEALVLPVARDRAGRLLEAALARSMPAAVLALGLAGDRAVVSVEQVAVNLDDYATPDADGAQPRGEPIAKDGPDALLATLPVGPLVQAIRSAGVPAALSRTAGTYLCNHVFYRLLEQRLRAAFLHLPPLPECVAGADNTRASMPLETSLRAVRAALNRVASLVTTSD